MVFCIGLEFLSFTLSLEVQNTLFSVESPHPAPSDLYGPHYPFVHLMFELECSSHLREYCSTGWLLYGQ